MIKLIRPVCLAAALVAGAAHAELDAAAIQEHIRSIGAGNVTCSVEGDVVTLSGYASDTLEAERVISEVERLDGVGRVVDQIVKN